jgi:hypothetical protein
VIAEPPVDAGAVHVTVAWPLPAVALTFVGAPGTPVGVTEEEALDAVLVPRAFVAVTVNVYAVPFVSPVTVALVVEPLTVAVSPPGDDVTV